MSRASGGQPALGNGTPEQVHLTWGDDPAASVVVSWVTPGRAMRPRVRIGQRVTLAQERSYADARSGKAVWAYHAVVVGLRPGATYGYAVTADNDASAQDPFTSTFRMAPTGRGRGDHPRRPHRDRALHPGPPALGAPAPGARAAAEQRSGRRRLPVRQAGGYGGWHGARC